MKKISYGLAALALIAAMAFKVVSDLPQKPTYFTLGRPTPTAVVSPADAAANGICRGTLTVEVFAPEMGVTQDDVDSYASRYTSDGKTCDEVTLLGSVDYENGTVAYIYRMNIAGKHLWYIFDVTDGKITDIN